MIETPVKAPPPSGPPSAPPPDARTRVMDLPPDPSGRHQHACSECGLPLHEDQAACLSCGAMVDQGSGYAGIRRAAVGSATALLVLGSAVGAAVAGLPHGKHVSKAPLAHVFTPKKAIPPATADSNTAPGGTGTTDLPGAGTGSKPPAIAPETPHGTDSSGLPSTPAPIGGGGGGDTGATSPGSGGSQASPNTEGAKKSHKPQKEPSKKPHKPAGPTLDPLGEQPAEASVFTTDGPSSASGADATIDNDAKTTWSTKKSDRGIMVTPNPGTYKAIRVVTETPGWSLEIYYSNADSPSSRDDWTFKSSTNAERSEKFSVPDAKHYWVLVADPAGTARINEIQVYQ
ncbi:MAG: hypothetical protein ACJ760_01235 [Thermoleophilaceae bacterium]